MVSAAPTICQNKNYNQQLWGTSFKVPSNTQYAHGPPYTPLPFRSSLFGKFVPRVVAAATTTHGLSEPLQVRAGPTEPRSDAASATATARRTPVPTGTGWEQLPAGSGVCHCYKAPISGAPTWCCSQNGSGETRTAGVKARKRKRRLWSSILSWATSLSLWGIQHVVQCGTARSPAHVLHWKRYLAIGIACRLRSSL